MCELIAARHVLPGSQSAEAVQALDDLASENATEEELPVIKKAVETKKLTSKKAIEKAAEPSLVEKITKAAPVVENTTETACKLSTFFDLF